MYPRLEVSLVANWRWNRSEWRGVG